MNRDYFREPIDSIFECAKNISLAVDAHIAEHRSLARDLIASTNLKDVRDWLDSIWGKGSPYVNFRVIESAPKPKVLSKECRTETRMPSSPQKRLLHQRDGFHCRFCGIPVIRKEVRAFLHKEYPDALPWGRTNATQHAAFQALWAQYDHIIPHARGGTNELDNMVIACAACNFGRMSYTLEEVGINDPRNRQPTRSEWNGLEHVLKESCVRQYRIDHATWPVPTIE